MSGWADNLADLSAACTSQAAFGEPVTMTGGSIISGIFDLPDPNANEIGRRLRLSDQDNPSLQILEADAAAIVEGSRLMVRGLVYEVFKRWPADTSGVVRLDMTEATDSEIDDAVFTETGVRYY